MPNPRARVGGSEKGLGAGVDPPAEEGTPPPPPPEPSPAPELTDGFHLIIDALKLNGLNTIYGVPGIPITDFGRMAQASGIRVLSFRHEQNAGNAAAIAGYLTKKPGVCLTVSAPGFLNGLTALANATTNCFPMILLSGSSEREIVDLQQGDYEEMDQLAIAKPLCKAAFRVLHAADIGIGVARFVMVIARSTNSLVSSSSLLRESLIRRCRGPLASDVMNGMLISDSTALESSILARSAASVAPTAPPMQETTCACTARSSPT
jgi:hypothetical protein